MSGLSLLIIQAKEVGFEKEVRVLQHSHEAHPFVALVL